MRKNNDLLDWYRTILGPGLLISKGKTNDWTSVTCEMSGDKVLLTVEDLLADGTTGFEYQLNHEEAAKLSHWLMQAATFINQFKPKAKPKTVKSTKGRPRKTAAKAKTARRAP